MNDNNDAMFFLIQSQNSAYEVTIGVYNTEEAAQQAADDMDAACLTALGSYHHVTHYVKQVVANIVIADAAFPWNSHKHIYNTTKHFEHIAPGYCGPPPVETDGVISEYQGRTTIISGQKSGELLAKLQIKIMENTSYHAKRRILQLVGYRTEESFLVALALFKDIELSELERKVLNASFYLGPTFWNFLN